MEGESCVARVGRCEGKKVKKVTYHGRGACDFGVRPARRRFFTGQTLLEQKSLVPVADDILSELPGGQLIREGLIDHQAGRRTVASCLVEMAAPVG